MNSLGGGERAIYRSKDCVLELERLLRLSPHELEHEAPLFLEKAAVFLEMSLRSFNHMLEMSDA